MFITYVVNFLVPGESCDRNKLLPHQSRFVLSNQTTWPLNAAPHLEERSTGIGKSTNPRFRE